VKSNTADQEALRGSLERLGLDQPNLPTKVLKLGDGRAARDFGGELLPERAQVTRHGARIVGRAQR
jgi:hypothetical protein